MMGDLFQGTLQASNRKRKSVDGGPGAGECSIIGGIPTSHPWLDPAAPFEQVWQASAIFRRQVKNQTKHLDA